MLFADENDRSPQSDVVTEELMNGELVFAVEGGGVRKAAGTDSRIDGIVDTVSGDHIAEDPYDFRTNIEDFTYKPSEDARASFFAGGEGGAYLRVRTPTDEGYTAPNIQQWSVVGIPDIAGYEGRLVEEGYTADPDGDGTDTTYSRSNSNFLAVGLALPASSQVPQTAFDDLFHVQYRPELQ